MAQPLTASVWARASAMIRPARMASIFCSLLSRVMPGVGGALQLMVVLVAIEGEFSDPVPAGAGDLGQGHQDRKVGPEMR